MVIHDTGENWNERYQKIISLPEGTELERSSKYIALDALNKDCEWTLSSLMNQYLLYFLFG